MSIANVLREARVQSGLTQLALAERTGIAVPNISAIEAGRRVPRFDTAETLLRGVGVKLIPVELGRSTAWEASAYIREALAQRERGSAFRTWLQLNNDLAAVSASSRYLLALQAPGPTGSPQWDAALAALVEFRLHELNLPIPEWVFEETRYLPHNQTLKTYDALNYEVAPEECAEEFVRHGVLFPVESLVSY